MLWRENYSVVENWFNVEKDKTVRALHPLFEEYLLPNMFESD